MNGDALSAEQVEEQDRVRADADLNEYCPVCNARLVHEKCKVVCRSATCTYRIVFNCSEF